MNEYEFLGSEKTTIVDCLLEEIDIEVVQTEQKHAIASEFRDKSFLPSLELLIQEICLLPGK